VNGVMVLEAWVEVRAERCTAHGTRCKEKGVGFKVQGARKRSQMTRLGRERNVDV